VPRNRHEVRELKQFVLTARGTHVSDNSLNGVFRAQLTINSLLHGPETYYQFVAVTKPLSASFDAFEERLILN
jgi:hypothetical protein